MGISIARTFGRQITRRLQPTAKTSCRNSPPSVEMTAIFYSGRAWAVVGRSARGEGGRGEGRGGRFPCQDSRRFPSCGALPARARGAGRARPTPVKVTLVAGILPPRLYAASSPRPMGEPAKKDHALSKGCPRPWKAGGKRGTPASWLSKARAHGVEPRPSGVAGVARTYSRGRPTRLQAERRRGGERRGSAPHYKVTCVVVVKAS